MTALEKAWSGSLVIQAIGGRLNSGQVLAAVRVKNIGYRPRQCGPPGASGF